MTFSVGDRVRYKTTKPHGAYYWDPNKIGWVGYVKEWKSGKNIQVCWDHMVDEVRKHTGVYPNNLELDELKYDPAQQGETDQDI